MPITNGQVANLQKLAVEQKNVRILYQEKKEEEGNIATRYSKYLV